MLNGFFPVCDKTARPYRSPGALREWGLPYAYRQRGNPPSRRIPHAIAHASMPCCSTAARSPRRCCANGSASRSQPGRTASRRSFWKTTEPALAVARGAARFGALLHQSDGAHRRRGRPRGISGSPDSARRRTAERSLSASFRAAPRRSEAFEIAVSRTGSPHRSAGALPGLFLNPPRPRAEPATSCHGTKAIFTPLPPLQTIVRTSEPSASGRHSSRPPAREDERPGSAAGRLRQRPPPPAILATGIQPAPARPGQSSPDAAGPGHRTQRHGGRLAAAAETHPGRCSPAHPAAPTNWRPVRSSKALERILGLPRSTWNGPCCAPSGLPWPTVSTPDTLGGSRGDMARLCRLPAAPRLRRRRRRTSHRQPVAAARGRPLFSRPAHQEPGIPALAPGGGRPLARTPDQSFWRQTWTGFAAARRPMNWYA